MNFYRPKVWEGRPQLLCSRLLARFTTVEQNLVEFRLLISCAKPDIQVFVGLRLQYSIVSIDIMLENKSASLRYRHG